MTKSRSRWAAVGAAVAVTLGAGTIGVSYATSPEGASAFVPVTPCRVMDTRSGADTVGPRNQPLGAAFTHTAQITGDNGECTGAGAVPSGATGVALNVTAVNPTAGTYITVWPADVQQPTASNLNVRAGDGPTPNKVDVKLSVDGKVSFFNFAGSVDLVADVTGYYIDHRHDVSSIDNETGVVFVDVMAEQEVSTNFTRVASVPIRVPSDGFLHVSATGNWSARSNGSDTMICQIQLGNAATVDPNKPFVRLDDHGVSFRVEHGFSMQRTIPITAANPSDILARQAVGVVCKELSGDMRVNAMHITAMFIPTAYTPMDLPPIRP